VASYAIGQAVNVILGYQLLSQFHLIGRVLIVDVENLRLWPDKTFGLSMAVEAPIHVQSVDFISE
jgi:hypothetical protein